MKLRFFLLLTLLFSLAACNRDVGVEVNEDGTATITVSLTESEVNSVIQTAMSNSENPLLRNPSVDLQPGQIVISGEHERRDGGGRVSGTVTVSVAAVNGELQVTITDVNVEGWDVSDEQIQEFNNTIADRLGGRARQGNGNATLESVSITDDNLSFAIRVSR